MTFFFFFFFLMFPLHHTACGIFVPIPWIKPVPSVLKVQSYPLDHQGILRVECVAVFHWLSGDSFALAELWLSKKEKIFLLLFGSAFIVSITPLSGLLTLLIEACLIFYTVQVYTHPHTHKHKYIYIYIYI